MWREDLHRTDSPAFRSPLAALIGPGNEISYNKRGSRLPRTFGDDRSHPASVDLFYDHLHEEP